MHDRLYDTTFQFYHLLEKYMFHIDGVVAKMMYRAAYIFRAWSRLSWSSVHVSSCLRFIHFGTSLKVT